MSISDFEMDMTDKSTRTDADRPTRVYLYDHIGDILRPDALNMEHLRLMEKVRSLKISEGFIARHMEWIRLHLLPYLITSRFLEELVVPPPNVFPVEFINSVREFLTKKEGPVGLTWVEGQVKDGPSEVNKEYVNAVKELLAVAQEKAVKMQMLTMARYLNFMREEWQEDAVEMIQKLEEIDDGSFPLLGKGGTLIGKAEKLEKLSIKVHEKVPEDFDYKRIFPRFAELLPKKLKRVRVSLPMCRESLKSLSWPTTVVDIGVIVSPFEKRLEKVFANIGAQCPLLKSLNLCLKTVSDPNRAFSCIRPGAFKSLRNLQVKTSVHAKCLLNDSSLMNLAQLPLVELVLCFHVQENFHPGKEPLRSIPGSWITLKGLDAVCRMEDLLCFTVRIERGWEMRKKLEKLLGAAVERMEDHLEERKGITPTDKMEETTAKYTLAAMMASRKNPNWFFTMPVILLRAMLKS